MPVAVDIIICAEFTSSIVSYYNTIHQMILNVSAEALGNIQANVRLGLIKFRSNDDAWKLKIYGFAPDINTLEHWFNDGIPVGGSRDEHEAVGDALHAALAVQWRTNANQLPIKKLVILITDGAPSGLFGPLTGEDPWAMSKEFKKRGITLAVVGVEPSIVECEDFYCALASNTGGKYLPLINAERILVDVIESVVFDQLKFREAFYYINNEEIEQNSLFNYSHVRSRVNGMMEECETIADIRRYFYAHLH